jgi:ATP-dependent RNA helicase DeaD
VLDIEHPVSAIVFCRTRTEVDELGDTLAARGWRAEPLHGGLSQEQRDRVMQRFRGRKTDLLVATDVAARGLDVQHVSHVINYDVPVAPDAYVHRIGRTGRAGRSGVAITLAEPREHRLLRLIERATRQEIEVAPIPTVADLHARRREIQREALRETILAGGLDAYRGIVASLAEEFDVLDVAAAAVKQADTNADGDTTEEHIADATPPPAPRRSSGPTRTRAPDTTRLFIAGGRALRITPADLVGAIANEAGISGRAIGAIHIDARHATVEVPRDAADAVVEALRTAKIKGKRLSVRRDRAD